MSAPAETAALPKVRIATTSLAGCFGCHMSFLDIDERILDLIKIAEFDRSPMTDIKHCGPCDIALIEGGVCNAENVHVLRELRANAKILVAVGACAINGGLPAMRNRLDVGDILNEVYRDADGVRSRVPNDPELPLLFDKVYPVNEVVRVDYFIPGCPPSADAIWKYLNDLILGTHAASRSRSPALRLRAAAMLNLETAQSPHKLRRVAIEPVTRVEGHGKVTILLDDENRVHQVRLHIVEFRGFEVFIRGRPYWEVPVAVQRLCGICPVSHLLAATKAMDLIAGLRAAHADGGEASAPAALRADRSVARAAFLSSRLARPAARLRERGRQAQHPRRRRCFPRSREARRDDAQVRAGSHSPYRGKAHSRHRASSPAA